MEQNTNQNFTNEGQGKNKGMAILSYIWILAIIPYFACKEDKWVRNHAVQGLNLAILSIITGFALSIVAFIAAIIPGIGGLLASLVGLVSSIVSLGFFVLCILGIVAAAQGEYKDLPIVSKIKIIK